MFAWVARVLETPPRLWRLAVIALVLTLLATPAFAQNGAPPTVPPPDNDTCLACHGDPAFVGSNNRPLAVDANKFGGSIHGKLGLACVDCHSDFKTTPDLPHAEKLAPVNCGTCHEAAVTAYTASIHGRAYYKSG